MNGIVRSFWSKGMASLYLSFTVLAVSVLLCWVFARNLAPDHWGMWPAIETQQGYSAVLGGNKVLLQSLAVALSVGSLLFLYLLGKHWFHKYLCLFLVLRYVLTPGFLGYCESVSLLPFNDLILVAFYWSWLVYVRGGDGVPFSLPISLLIGGIVLAPENGAYFIAWVLGFWRQIPSGRKQVTRFLVAGAVIFLLSVVIRQSLNVSMGGRALYVLDALKAAFGLSSYRLVALVAVFCVLLPATTEEFRKRLLPPLQILALAGLFTVVIFPRPEMNGRDFLLFSVFAYGVLIQITVELLRNSVVNWLPRWVVAVSFLYSALYLNLLYTEPLHRFIRWNPSTIKSFHIKK